jgi:hypothetical protein
MDMEMEVLGSWKLDRCCEINVSMQMEPWRPTQCIGFRVNEYPTKVSINTSEQQQFSMTIQAAV